jgi:hypothetical protein
VKLIGMEDHDLARHAHFSFAAVVESLDTACRQANGIGVVTVPVVGRAVEPGFQIFDPILRSGAAQPIAREFTARSFKTDTAGLLTIAVHTQ